MTFSVPTLVDELNDVCRRLAPTTLLRTTGYRPTQQQLAFFTLFRIYKAIKKNGNLIQDDAAQAMDINIATHKEYVRLVGEHLATESGEIVSNLQKEDAKMWRLLADVQLPRALRRMNCPNDLKDDAIGNALIKLTKIIFDMRTHCPANRIDESQSLWEIVAQLLADHINIYDFRTHFYLFGQTIVRNELFSLLRRQPRELPLTFIEEWLVNWFPDEVTIEDETMLEQQQRLRAQLPKLFGAIKALTPTRQAVAYYTLAARPQFWRALQLAGATPPADFPARDETLDDIKIGLLLGIQNRNNVAVHRLNASKQLRKLDPALADLFRVLIELHFE